MANKNILDETLLEKTVYVSHQSVFSTSQEMSISGVILLRTLSDLIGALPNLDAVTPSDIYTSLKVAEELILATGKEGA